MRQDDPQGLLSAAEADDHETPGPAAREASDRPAGPEPSVSHGGGSRTGAGDTDFDSDELLRTISGLESKLERLKESHVRAAAESEAMREATHRAAEEAAGSEQADREADSLELLYSVSAARSTEEAAVPLVEAPAADPEPCGEAPAEPAVDSPADADALEIDAAVRESGASEGALTIPIRDLDEGPACAHPVCAPLPSESEMRDVRRLTQDLDEREGLIEAQYERIDAEWQDIQRARAEVQGRVARLDEDAARHEAAMRAIEEERARLAELEKEAGAAIQRAEAIGVEMARMKRVVTDLQAQSPDARARQAEARRKARIRFRRALAGSVWVVTACILFASLAAMAFAPGSGLGLTLMGLAFGAHFFGSMLVAGRIVDVGTIPIGMLGTSIGLWVPAWERLTASTLMTLDVPLEIFPAATHDAVPMAIAAATAAAVMGVGLLVLCGSFGLFGVSMIAAAVLGVTLLIDGPVPGVGVAGAVVWVVLMGAALSRWATRAGREPNPFQPE